MFLARYFLYVGGALLALLLVVSAELPQTRVAPSTNTAAELPAIRINSDRKWPAKVVFDTSAPTIVPTRTASNAVEALPPAPEVAKAPPQEAFAQLAPSDLKNSSVKKLESKPRQRRRIARRHVSPPMGPRRMMVAQQPPFGFGFGFFGSRVW